MSDPNQHVTATPEAFRKAFAACTKDALLTFRNTDKQCVGLCAAISWSLTEDGVPNKVALGSLSCEGVLAFKYSGPFVTDGSVPLDWDGHAWIEFPGGIIGEPSLLRTAKAAPRQSNLRQSLERQGLIDKGAFILPENDTLAAFGLKYTRMAYLAAGDFDPLIRGLVAMNPPAP
ncbi:hypothetical protein [Methylobacterium longum]|uniref:Uncharacterized protein n=1 Tax=Methylobacterium longum TaxID=767694 RepID=A0ABT8AT75_9HYPH|nr:hypothetical protein [Methylobacterium longum]MDN3572940.1 hypothetical protein [Methylobacterium longum]GJE14577.1 hypothetical protein FOHLNKBM_5652 [Methylobacterium longum]